MKVRRTAGWIAATVFLAVVVLTATGYAEKFLYKLNDMPSLIGKGGKMLRLSDDAKTFTWSGLTESDSGAITIGTTAPRKPSGTLTVGTTQTATGANTEATVLWTYDLPANTMATNGDVVRVRAFGTCAANGNNKTIQLFFGVPAVSTVGAAAINNNVWYADFDVIRTGAATQLALGGSEAGGIAYYSHLVPIAPTEDLTAAVTIKVVGTNGSASAGDVVFKGAIVEYMPK